MISIIVPVYNVAEYLNECIKSLINQTYKDIEIILVDDGSTDDSGSICDKWAKLCEKIRVIHKINGGQSSARNIGLDISNGEWVCFVDSDDFIEPNYCELLLETAIDNKTDIAACSYNKIIDGKKISQEESNNCKIFSIKEILLDLVSNQFLRFEVWNKIWKKNIIKSVRFIEGKNCEEVKFLFDVLPNIEKISYIDAKLYNYRVNRPGSTLSTFKTSKLYIFSEFERLNMIISKYNFYDDIKYIPSLLSIKYSYNFSNEAIKGNKKIIKEELLPIFNKNYKYLKKIKYHFSFKDKMKYNLFLVFKCLYLKIRN